MFGFEKEKERKKLVEAFAGAVRPELLDALQSPDAKMVVNSFCEARLNFVFLCIDGSVPEEIGRTIGAVADITRCVGWDVEGMFSNLMVLVDGPPLAASTERGGKSKLVATLISELGPKVKMLHGTRNAAWGLYGSETGRQTCGMMLPDFVPLIVRLNTLRNGTAEELPE